MSGQDQGSDEPDHAMESAEEAEFKALVEQYVGKFGEEPCWWVLGSSQDRAQDIREAIRSGQPIVLNIPPGCDA